MIQIKYNHFSDFCLLTSRRHSSIVKKAKLGGHMNIKIGKKINQRFFYGWVILCVAIVSVFFSSPGQTYSISTFIESYIKDFGFTRTSISSIYSIATIASGFLLVFVGKAVDKHGQRKMALVVGGTLAVVCFMNSFIANLVMIGFSFFFLRYLGQGSMSLIPSSLTPQWFDKKRAFVMSISNYGALSGSFLVPIINTYFISQFSWQVTWRIWSVLLVVIFLPIAYFFIINKPEDIDALPDGEKAVSHEHVADELKKMTENSWSLEQAVRTRIFWSVGIIAMLIPMLSTGMVFHFFSIMALKGIDKTATSVVVGLMAVPGFFMPIFSMFIIDNMRSKTILTFTTLGIALSLAYFALTDSMIHAIVFILLYGFITNIQTITIKVIWPRYFGRKHLGSIQSAGTVFMVIGSALGTIPFGLSYDLTGSYQPIFFIMSGVCLVAMLVAITIKKPNKEDYPEIFKR